MACRTRKRRRCPPRYRRRNIICADIVRGTSMSICTSSGEDWSWYVRKRLVSWESFIQPFRLDADVLRKLYHAVARHLSGMPFHVRSMSFGEVVSKVYPVSDPPPTIGRPVVGSLAGGVAFAILRHFSSRSISLRRASALS